jgi:hypothetical protein
MPSQKKHLLPNLPNDMMADISPQWMIGQKEKVCQRSPTSMKGIPIEAMRPIQNQYYCAPKRRDLKLRKQTSTGKNVAWKTKANKMHTLAPRLHIRFADAASHQQQLMWFHAAVHGVLYVVLPTAVSCFMTPWRNFWGVRECGNVSWPLCLLISPPDTVKYPPSYPIVSSPPALTDMHHHVVRHFSV